MDQAKLATRIIEAWRNAGDVDMGCDEACVTDLAMRAATALLCGMEHPDRGDIWCTDTIEHAAALHRDSRVGLEWGSVGGGPLRTFHDQIGEVALRLDDHTTPDPGPVSHAAPRDHRPGAPAVQVLTAMTRAVDVLRQVLDARGHTVTAALHRTALGARNDLRAAFQALQDLTEVS